MSLNAYKCSSLVHNKYVLSDCLAKEERSQSEATEWKGMGGVWVKGEPIRRQRGSAGDDAELRE